MEIDEFLRIVSDDRIVLCYDIRRGVKGQCPFCGSSTSSDQHRDTCDFARAVKFIGAIREIRRTLTDSPGEAVQGLVCYHCQTHFSRAHGIPVLCRECAASVVGVELPTALLDEIEA